MDTLTVKAAGDLLVPREDNPRTYITQMALEVPASAYYLRRIADGDLVQVQASNKPKPKGE